MEKDPLKRMKDCGVVPVVVIDDADSATNTAGALLAGGIDVMEITLRTGTALEAIRRVAKDCPDICVGAGTVITLEQGKEAVKAGAQFIVSPGFDLQLVEWCLSQRITVTPGCVTPSEIMSALKLGLDVLKFFPAKTFGGLSAIDALAAPFVGVTFIPTGGVSPENLSIFASSPHVHAVGGSWMCPRSDIANGNYEKITRLSSEARQQIRACRQNG